ncbi:MAG TPA: protein-methionine-sulfoxide reductase heme-binding subunit MsrQ [Blastocatellia bacterium]|nr:protein-methionine-sulfoxide reductase heme-binding subunit MsrQ [Blastocatellia bacterium]
MTDVRFVKVVVFVNSLVPLAMLGWDWSHNGLGANPLEFVTHITGTLTLIYLLITLAITPLRRLSSQPWMVKLRRMVGLFAFFYGCLHLITYLWFDRFFKVGSIVADVGKRPFIAIGMAGFLMMVPLAVTSTNKMVKRIGGKRWNRLHKLVYVAGAAGVVHYWMLVKADTRIPLMFGVALAALLAYRIGVYAVKQIGRGSQRGEAV